MSLILSQYSILCHLFCLNIMSLILSQQYVTYSVSILNIMSLILSQYSILCHLFCLNTQLQTFQRYSRSPSKSDHQHNQREYSSNAHQESKQKHNNQNIPNSQDDSNTIINELIRRISGLESKLIAQERENSLSYERKDNNNDRKIDLTSLESKINYLLSDFTDLSEQVRK